MMYASVVLKRSSNVYDARSSNFVITVRALVVVVVTVSLSFFCNYLRIAIYQCTLRNMNFVALVMSGMLTVPYEGQWCGAQQQQQQHENAIPRFSI